ncbi:hypothetical protein ACGFXB_33165 [Streptomyces canus]|uniref:hypothetical protein n=1 Tax=Streptomyces canus TaxID=58343 RepID=UPI00371F492D
MAAAETDICNPHLDIDFTPSTATAHRPTASADPREPAKGRIPELSGRVSASTSRNPGAASEG